MIQNWPNYNRWATGPEFTGRPFVAGSLTGLRAFSVDHDTGRLCGVYHPAFFNTEGNQAVCFNGATPSKQAFDPDPLWETPEGHVLAGLDCTCGFYAYFDGANYYYSVWRVAALIEGFGVCTVGSRGFRASKARLLAMIFPPEGVPITPYPPWRTMAGPLDRPVPVEAIRACYPGVPVFPTIDEALVAFPLTKPPPVEPVEPDVKEPEKT